MTKADFQYNGILPLSIKIRKRWASPRANSSVASYSNLPGMLFGPVALWGLMLFSSFGTPLILTFMGGTLGVWLGPRSGNSDVSSWVKTEQNWSPMMLALLRLSEKASLSFFKGGTPVLSFLWNLMKFQKCFGFLLSFVNMSFVYLSCVSRQVFWACFLIALYLSQSLGCFYLLARLKQCRFKRVIRRTSLLIQGCVNLCEVVRDGILSCFILWHPSLKNDQTSLMLLMDVNSWTTELEISLHISFMPWMSASPHIKMVLLTGFCLVMVI